MHIIMTTDNKRNALFNEEFEKIFEQSIWFIFSNIGSINVHYLLSNTVPIYSGLPAAIEIWLVYPGIAVCEQ